MSKKFLSAILAVLMLFSLLPASAFAAEGGTGDFTLDAPALRVLTQDEAIGGQNFKAGKIVLESIPESLPYFAVEIREKGLGRRTLRVLYRRLRRRKKGRAGDLYRLLYR